MLLATGDVKRKKLFKRGSVGCVIQSLMSRSLEGKFKKGWKVASKKTYDILEYLYLRPMVSCFKQISCLHSKY